MEYLDLARKYVAETLGDDVDVADAPTCCARWESVLTGSRPTRCSAATELDWVAKLTLLQQYRDRDGLDWDDAKLQLIDLQYADIRPEKGLYHRLAARARSSGCSTDDDDRAPPCTTRPRTPAPTSAAAASRSTATTSPPRRGTR